MVTHAVYLWNGISHIEYEMEVVLAGNKVKKQSNYRMDFG